jgi:uncharacterized protein (DUF4415 family)
MKRETFDNLSAEQKAELAALSALNEEQINTEEIPEIRDWDNAQRGTFYRPIKQQITLHLDADLIDWFKKHHLPDEGYQTTINRALGEYIQEQQ